MPNFDSEVVEGKGEGGGLRCKEGVEDIEAMVEIRVKGGYD